MQLPTSLVSVVEACVHGRRDFDRNERAWRHHAPRVRCGRRVKRYRSPLKNRERTLSRFTITQWIQWRNWLLKSTAYGVHSQVFWWFVWRRPFNCLSRSTHYVAYYSAKFPRSTVAAKPRDAPYCLSMLLTESDKNCQIRLLVWSLHIVFMLHVLIKLPFDIEWLSIEQTFQV